MQRWSKSKKIAVVSAVSIFGLAVLGSLGNTKQNQTHVSPPTPPPTAVEGLQTNPEPQAVPVPSPPPPVTVPAPTPQPVYIPTPPPVSCPNGTYVNSAGNVVCSPYASTSAPAGATAKCVDGTYSFSQSHSGTCSHHGGVAAWL
jgi:hypothetical protein